MRMKLLFALGLVASAVLLAVLGEVAWPSTSAWMLGLVLWAIGVVPVSFGIWFAKRRRHEEDDTEAALRSWAARTPQAGALLATAVDEALEEEDERSLERLVRALEDARDEAWRAERDAFISAVRVWLADAGGKSSRDAHFEAARERARPVLAHLRGA